MTPESHEVSTERSTTAVDTKLALPALATEINRHHQVGTEAAAKAIEHALQCGRLLSEAKAQLEHGEFLPWLEANCDVKQRQAQNYMRLANNWQAIKAKAHPGADLTIKGALALIGDETRSDTRTTRQRANAEVIQSLHEHAAIGHLLNWAADRGEKITSFGWMFNLSRDGFDALIQHFESDPDSLFILMEMGDRAQEHYGLSVCPWPHSWVIAILRESGRQADADALAADVQQKVDVLPSAEGI